MRPTAAEVEALRALRDYRNEVAHELPAFLIDIDQSLDFTRYVRLVELFQKMERSRVRLNIDCNEKFDRQDIKDGDIRSGSMMLVDMMNEWSFGSPVWKHEDEPRLILTPGSPRH